MRQARYLGFVGTSSPGMGGMTHGMWVHMSMSIRMKIFFFIGMYER
jgi:hypothetical protein